MDKLEKLLKAVLLGSASRNAAVRYASAFIAVGIALLLTKCVPGVEQAPFYSFFLAAILASAIFGGLGPGVLAIILSALVTAWLVVVPRAEFDHGDAIRLALFMIVSFGLLFLVHMLASIVVQLQRAESDVDQEGQRLRFTLQSIADAVIAADHEGRITFLNPVAERITGWTLDEAAGQPLATVFDVVDRETRVRHEDPVSRVLRQNGHGARDTEVLIARDASTVDIESAGAPIRGAGKVMGVIVIFRKVAPVPETSYQRSYVRPN